MQMTHQIQMGNMCSTEKSKYLNYCVWWGVSVWWNRIWPEKMPKQNENENKNNIKSSLHFCAEYSRFQFALLQHNINNSHFACFPPSVINNWVDKYVNRFGYFHSHNTNTHLNIISCLFSTNTQNLLEFQSSQELFFNSFFLASTKNNINAFIAALKYGHTYIINVLVQMAFTFACHLLFSHHVCVMYTICDHQS